MYDVKKDILNKKYGRLLATSILGKMGGHYYIKCVCDCGKLITVTANNLKRNHTLSCGCLRYERLRKANTKHGQKGRIYSSPEYRAWVLMKGRCSNKNTKRFKDWGGRGIKVCKRWRTLFENFFADMGKRPSPFHSLDRYPNVNGDYKPSNCRWATIGEQNRNKRNNRWFKYGEMRMILKDWATYFGITQSTLSERLEIYSFKKVFIFYSQKMKNDSKRIKENIKGNSK